MSAIYSGIYTKLKNAKIPWEDKIKLAHFAWISHQCFLPNKEQVLLDWVCHALVGFHSKKLKLEEDVQQKLWCFLDSVLCSKKLEYLAKNGKAVNLRFAIAQVMNDFIAFSSVQQAPPAGISTVLNCCQTVLSNPTLAFVYTTKYELMVDLLSKLCTLACHYLNNPSEQPFMIQVLKTLHLSLTQYLQVQRQQSNPNRVFTHVVAHLFQPCLLLRHTLNVHVWSKDDDSHVRSQLIKDIRSSIETVLYSALFQPELLASYKEELLSEGDRSEKKKISPKINLTPVSSILAKLEDSSFCNLDTYVSLLANSISLMYKLFLDSYCKNGKEIFCFHMLVHLFKCLNSTIPFKQEDIATASAMGSIGLLALEELLNLALSHDIYNVAEDHIRHKDVQYQFYRELAEMLICNPCTSSHSWYRCLNNLILLNHLIVEPDLDDLLSCAWIDADILDLRVRKAQEALISSLFQTYTKLRQFPKLFQEVVTLICRPAADELRQPILTSSLSEKLADFLIQLPPNQILDVWAIILERCACDILPDIKDDPDVCLKLGSLSSLLHCLLFNMKSLDNSTPLPVLTRFNDLMKQMMDKLIMPSLTALQEDSEDNLVWLPTLCDAVLLLLFTWIELNTVTKQNCNKYVSQIKELPLLESPTEGLDFSLFCGDKNCWKKVYKYCTESNPLSKFYIELLSIQKMKYILTHYAFVTESVQLTLQNAAFLIIHPVSDLHVPKEHTPWSGSANIVDASSIHVARWHLIAANIPIILPYIPLASIYNITDFLLETIPSAQYTKDHTDKDSSVSFTDISNALLKSDHFAELPVLQCAFITSIINKCGMALKEKNYLNIICDLLSAKDLHWHEDFLSSYSKGAKTSANVSAETVNDKISGCVTNLEAVVQCILSLAIATKSDELCDLEINQLINIIEFISALKPDSLSPSDQCRCFFLLLSITRATSLRSLQLAGVCYKLMICLLHGKHAKSLFKLLFASDILKTVIICFQPSEMEFADNIKNKQYWPEFVSTVQSFLDTILALILERKQSCLLNLEKFAEFVFHFVPNPKSKDWNSCIGQLLISVLNGLCRVLTTCIQEHIADKKKTETFLTLLQQSVVTMNIVVTQCLKVSTPSQILPSFLVSCTTTLLEAELCSQDKIKAQNIEVYRSFCLQILRELPYAEKQTLFLKAAFRYLVLCISVEEIYSTQQMLVTSIFHSMKALLASPWMNDDIVQSVEQELMDLFNQMMERCTFEEFNAILQSTLQGLEISNMNKNSNKEIDAGITLTKLLLNCPLKEDKGKVFWFTASQIMTALITLVNESSKDRSLLSYIVVPVMDTMALLLRCGETYLSNPHHVTLSFNTLLTVPLDHLRFEEYYRIFLAVHEVLFSILQCHPKAMLESVESFLSTFHRLVSSVMHEGQQKGDKGSAHELETILKCAQLVQRMYTHIAAKTEEFTVFSAFMVSQYVNELQKVTLQPAIKKHLTAGIFHILDLCIERDIKFLNSSLQMGVREIFKELYKEYTHQHKIRSQEEEKYKAL